MSAPFGGKLVTVLVTVPARFWATRDLGTTKGQLYNLLNRREVPYVPWGKRGKRFRRIDLIAWQEDRRRPALE